MKREVREYTAACQVYQFVKGGIRKQVTDVIDWARLDQDDAVVAFDTWGPFSAYAAGARGAGSREQYLVTVMDVWKKYVEEVPVRSVDAEVVVKKMLVGYINVFSAFAVILTDRGAQFTGKLMKCFCALLDMKHCLTTFRHPQTNGALERFHPYLGEHLSTHALEHGELKTMDWTLVTSCIVMQNRATVVQRQLSWPEAKAVFSKLSHGTLGQAQFKVALHMGVKEIRKEPKTTVHEYEPDDLI